MSKLEKVGFLVLDANGKNGNDIIDVSDQWDRIIEDSVAAGLDKKILWNGKIYRPLMSTSEGQGMIVALTLDVSRN